MKFFVGPIFESKSDYSIPQTIAKKRLGIADKTQIILYFGWLDYGKGPDILLDAARHFEDQDNVKFWFVGRKRGNFGFQPPDQPNVVFVDEFIPPEDVPMYFCASDLVVIPYRKSYRYSASGVLPQAVLAGKPVVAPSMTPFQEVVSEFELGGLFECESPTDLSKTIRKVLEASIGELNSGGPQKFLDSIESWDDNVRNLY